MQVKSEVPICSTLRVWLWRPSISGRTAARCYSFIRFRSGAFRMRATQFAILTAIAKFQAHLHFKNRAKSW